MKIFIFWPISGTSIKTFILSGFSFSCHHPIDFLLRFSFFHSFTRTDTHTQWLTHSPDFFFFLSPMNKFSFLFLLFKLAGKYFWRFFVFNYYMIHLKRWRKASLLGSHCLAVENSAPSRSIFTLKLFPLSIAPPSTTFILLFISYSFKASFFHFWN